ncbi:MAG: L-threonine 3-dehydrogenase [Acidobacteria bacterium]|nr:MAG: L-threonine 3-dehydrogenase [Acidobacteriota bacterium]
MPSATMQAIVKPEPKPGARLEEVRIPDLGPGDVLVEVRAASICGTDLHIYKWDHWSAKRIRPPLVFGHEFCGTVVRVGAEVEIVREGDFVSAEMHLACGRCFQCRTGQRHICQNVRIIGVDTDGCFAEFVKIPETNIWKIDPAIAVEYAAVLDPLGNAVHTVLAGEIAGLSVAVTGCGPIGLFAIAVARASGAGAIIATEPHPFRQKLAEKVGASMVVDPETTDAVAEVLAATNGVGADVVLEMSGNPRAVRQAFQMLRRGGRISLLGIPSKPLELDLANDVIFKGAVVQGINGRRVFETWYQMQALLKSGRLDLAPLITDRIGMADFEHGMELLLSGNASKVLMFPNGKPPKESG